jgi:hypothetical protein
MVAIALAIVRDESVRNVRADRQMSIKLLSSNQ